MQASRRDVPAVWLSVAVAAAAMALAACSTRNLDILWDEQVDLDISAALADHPLTGERPALDASQLRLPMYVNAAVFRSMGQCNLGVSRGVSLAMGGITVVAAAALAAELFGPVAAILAALLLGFSPYFVSFARIAMTEGDVFFSCLTTLSVWAFVRYLKRPTPGRWAMAGVFLGLAVGAKVFGLFLFLVFAVVAASTGPSHDITLDARPGRVRRLHRALIGGLCAVALGIAASATERFFGDVAFRASGCFWAAALTAWVIAVVSALGRGALATGRVRRLAAMLAFALLTCGVMLPVHTTRFEIAREVARRAVHWDHRLPLALWSDHLRLYSGIVLLKQTIPLGVVMAAALIYGAFREQRDGRWRVCVLSVIFYIALLCFLPLRQTFYLMGVYPLMMVVSAGFMVEVHRRLSRAWRPASGLWAAAVVVMLSHLGFRLYAGYPDYHLYGHDVIGDRWLGAESRGYRNLIQTPSDGVAELMEWCETDPRVRPGSRVVSYLWEGRIIAGLLPAAPRYRFVPRGLSDESDIMPAAPDIVDADFVLLHINNLLGYGDRPPDLPPMDFLLARFEKAHTVWRGGMEVAWAYARR